MSRRLTILLVDDNPHDRHLVLRELRIAYPNADILEAVDQQQFDQLLASHPFDVVVTDYHLHWSDGIQVLRAVKARAPHCPVIMFTGTGNEEVAVQAMKHGLDDYIIKSVKHLVRLRSAVEAVIDRAEDRARADEATYQLDRLLSHLDVGVFSCTAEGEIIELNEAMVRLMGCETALDATKKGLVGLFGSAEELRQSLARLVATGIRQEIEVEVNGFPDGERCFLINTHLASVSGRPVRVDGLVEDVTARKQAEVRAKAAAVAAAQIAMLSEREQQVLQHVVAGEANKVIARRLDISEKTIEKHRSSLMKKLNVRNVAELVRVALLAGVDLEA
jgi:DNA-binding NarL/FixJ family response regulator